VVTPLVPVRSSWPPVEAFGWTVEPRGPSDRSDPKREGACGPWSFPCHGTGCSGCPERDLELTGIGDDKRGNSGENGPMRCIAQYSAGSGIEPCHPRTRVPPSTGSTHPRLRVLNPVATLSLKWVDRPVDISTAALLPFFVCGSRCARLVVLTPRESGAVWLLQTGCGTTGSVIGSVHPLECSLGVGCSGDGRVTCH